MVAAGDQSTGSPWGALLTPSERLGWIFEDRDRYRTEFAVPAPPEASGSGETTAHELRVLERLPQRMAHMRKAAVLGALLGLVVFGRLAMGREVGWSFAGLAISVVLGAGLGALAWRAIVHGHLRAVRGFWDRRRLKHRSRAEVEYAAWLAQRQAHDAAEAARVGSIPQWREVQVTPGARRVDVVGGNLWGWEALLTVFGTSTLTARGPVTVLDLSGELVVRELAGGAAEGGLDVDVQLLPTELVDSDLMVGLEPAQLAELVVESLHGGTEAAGRAERAVDTRVITAVCEVLAPGGLTMGRIAAGMRVLMGEPALDTELSSRERAHLADELFSEAYRARSAPMLQRIEAIAHGLGPLGARTASRPAATLRCVAMSTQWSSGGQEFLCDLLVAWAGRQVAADGRRIATLVVAGADVLAPRHLAKLTDLCDRRSVRLVAMFRTLSEQTAGLLGGGPTAFMRLGNHQEAARAADYIGMEHSFVLSQVTHTHGGEQSHSSAQGEGGSQGSSTSRGRERGASRTSMLGPRTRQWSRSDSSSWNTERNWSQTLTEASGASWSEAGSLQRVYEHRIEPRVLQRLPDYALLLVEHAPAGTRVQAVEVNPQIALWSEPQSATAARPYVPPATSPVAASAQRISIEDFRAGAISPAAADAWSQLGHPASEPEPAWRDRGAELGGGEPW